MTGPLWYLNFARTGRRFGFIANVQAVGDRFRANSGFISTGDMAQVSLGPSLTFYGKQGALIERFTTSATATYTWAYQRFIAGVGPRDRQYWFNGGWTLRGGYGIGATLFVETFGFDDA